VITDHFFLAYSLGESTSRKNFQKTRRADWKWLSYALEKEQIWWIKPSQSMGGSRAGTLAYPFV
jgi:hypothetical protein